MVKMLVEHFTKLLQDSLFRKFLVDIQGIIDD